MISQSWRDQLKKVPGLKKLVKAPARARIAWGYLRPRMDVARRWVFSSSETSNFTYDLDPRNEKHLGAFVAAVTGTDIDRAMHYIRELQEDGALREHLFAQMKRHGFDDDADRAARFGRRAGWYAITRLLRPRVVVETGVDKGLGTCVLAAALARNTAEGFPGRVFGLDINPEAGFLLDGAYQKFGELVFGDSLQTLPQVPSPIDLFINDSDHSSVHEGKEYRLVQARLSPQAVILGDNAHCSDELLEFAQRSKRRYLFFQEAPANHWYPGAGIGAAFFAPAADVEKQP